jgi:hypothetical protein
MEWPDDESWDEKQSHTHEGRDREQEPRERAGSGWHGVDCNEISFKRGTGDSLSERYESEF